MVEGGGIGPGRTSKTSWEKRGDVRKGKEAQGSGKEKISEVEKEEKHNQNELGEESEGRS